MVKDELTSEEKFFEKAVVTEKFVKKYKNIMIGSVAAIVLLVAGDIGYTINKQNTIDSANEVLGELQTTPNNPAQLARLASLSPALSDLWNYSQAIANKDVKALEKLKDSKTILIGDLSSYYTAQEANNTKALDSYASKNDAIYADLARLQTAILLMNEKKIEQAHEKLSMVSVDSPLAQVAQALMHYGVK